MRIQLWRNATLKLTLNDTNFLIDPMLGDKHSFGIFPWTDDDQMNPLVNLPFTKEELTNELESIDAVIVTHLHPDHWDATAVSLLPKTIPLICPKANAENIASYGFTNIKAINEVLTFQDIQLSITDGQHGTGTIGTNMGKVNGFVLKHLNNSIYITGDTIWCEEVKNAIDKHHPKHIIVAGGAATFAFGEPVTMTFDDINHVAGHAPNSKIWITHLEAVSPCKEGRSYLRDLLKSSNLEKQCVILEDGEKANLIY
ncbi:beta-lactamase family protein [Flavobacteriaceae bacterium MAR_2010_72]|nr:beta-lactamase family protein [Flavobacteriaceae bacterium MAR_2010_72]